MIGDLFRWRVALALLALLALLVQPVAGVQAQGAPGTPEADKAQKSRATQCAVEYAASTGWAADPASEAIMKVRSVDLEQRFDINPFLVSSSALSILMNTVEEEPPEAKASKLAVCDREFGFTPVTMLSGVTLVIPQAAGQAAARQTPANQAASGQTTPRFSDLACGSIFWVAALAWQQEREGWLRYANGAIDRHVAATPKDTRPQAEARVMADGQARARLLQQGGAEPEKFKRDLDVCAAQFGIKPNAPTPAAAPAPPPVQAPAAAAPAASQNPSALVVPWGVSDKPQGDNPTSFCMIWAGKTQPMFNFAVYENDAGRVPKLLMSAPWLRGRADRSPVDVKVEFPDGTRWETRGIYVVERDLTVTVMPSLDELYQKLSRPGVISLEIGGTSKRFQVPNFDRVPAAMRSCIAALPAATAS